MKISEQMKGLIQERLHEPLVLGEVRHIPELGEYYIALPGDVPKMEGHTFRRQYNLTIDGVVYSIYMRDIGDPQDH